MIGCLVLQIYTFRRHGEEIRVDDPIGEEEKAQTRAEYAKVRRYVSWISVLVFFGVLARYRVDYAFLHQTQSRFGQADEIAAFDSDSANGNSPFSTIVSAFQAAS